MTEGPGNGQVRGMRLGDEQEAVNQCAGVPVVGKSDARQKKPRRKYRQGDQNIDRVDPNNPLFQESGELPGAADIFAMHMVDDEAAEDKEKLESIKKELELPDNSQA